MQDKYSEKILRVNLTEKKIETHSLSEDITRKYIGGSGLAAKILYEETFPNIDPLGEDNLLIFMAGPFTGTPVPCGRHSVVAKSPLTGIWGEASVGGYWGKELKRTGYGGIVIKGSSEEPVYLYIDNGEIEIRGAGYLWGKDNYEVDQVLKEEIGKDIVVSSIGPAGEKLIRISGIFTDGKDSRAAARCGLGAVAGSKKLKAVVVRGSKKPKVFYEEKLKKSLKEIIPSMREIPKRLKNLGTANLVIPCEQIGDFPIKNWREGEWDKAERISGEEMAETILLGHYHCAGCPIGCGRKVKISEGPYAGVEGAGPEYETLGLMGGSCLVDNLEAIAKANELCNRYGIDTIEVGGAIAFAMEAYERGLIKKEDAGGVSLRWGNPEALIEMIHQIGEGKGLGKLLGEGVARASQKIGGLALEFAIHSKGLAFPAHDPRAYNSIALGYATSNRGACHLQGFTHVFERGLTSPELGYSKVQEPFGQVGKGEFVAKLQNLMCLFDSLAICKFTLFGGVSVSNLLDWLNFITGWNMSLEEFMKAGERIFNLKRLYNVNCGVSRKDDTLPFRILTHKRGKGGAANNLPPLGRMLGEYYEYRKWNEYGIPSNEKLNDLEIKIK